MKHCARLPWKPGIHFDARVVYESEVINIHQLYDEDHGVDGEHEQRQDDGDIIECQLNGTHCRRRICCGGVVPEHAHTYTHQ